MAKYAYNINKENKILEVQKQFPGGLKTVDTDDALGKVFLREAENVSLSEFSFLEKRYGTYIEEEFKFQPGDEPNFNKPIQGYFEFTRNDGEVDKLLFIGGFGYIKTAESDVFVKKQFFRTEPGFEYVPPSIYTAALGGIVIGTQGSFQGEAFFDSLTANFSTASDQSFSIVDLTPPSMSLHFDQFEGLTANIFKPTELNPSISSVLNGSLSASIEPFKVILPPQTVTLNFPTVFEGKGIINTIRVKSTSPVPIVLPMTWNITARNYNESGTTNYNRDNFTIVREDVPGIVVDAFGTTDSRITFSIQDSFMSGGSIYVLDGVTTTHGNLVTLGVNQFRVENIEDDVDITIAYKVQTSEV